VAQVDYPTLQPSPDALARLIKEGAFLLKVFHDEFAKDKTGRETEYWRGQLAGWRHALDSSFGESVAHSILELVRKRTTLTVPHCGPLSKDLTGYLGTDMEAEFPTAGNPAPGERGVKVM